MKRISRYIGSAVATLLLTACSGFLEEHNATNVSDIVSSKDTMESGMLGVQHGFVGTWDGLSGMGSIYLDYASGLSTWNKDTYFSKAEYLCFMYFTFLANYNGGVFECFYKVISRANDIIDNLADSPLDEAFKMEMKAEAMFYRAVAYFYLVRIYGDVPLRLGTSSSQDATSCPRSPYYKVYEQIVKDLQFAEANMRTPQRVKEATPGYPRPNRYAATAYLSNVYCTIGSLLASPEDNFWNPAKPERVPDFSAIDIPKGEYAAEARAAYQKALLYAEKLLPESATHDAGCEYHLLEKFGDMFRFDPEFTRSGYTAYLNPEQIFTISGSTTAGFMAPYVQYRLPEYAEGTSNVEANSNAGRCRPVRYLFQKWCQTYPGDKAANLTDDTYCYKNSKDPRLDPTFYHGLMKYCTGTGSRTFYPLENGTSANTMLPYYKKTASKNGIVKFGDSDIIMMRLAQVYLIAAEAAAYLDDEATARKYIGVLHARARHSVADDAADSSMPTWDNVSFSTKQDLLDAIFWENEFELAGESQDYFNVHRHGARWIIRNICIPKNSFGALADNTSMEKKYFPDFKYPENYDADPADPTGDVFTIRKGLLFSFPTNELNYNTGITVEQAKNDYNYDR